jgi:HPt (histidine-containing phosphotransfer) domain-containing protein
MAAAPQPPTPELAELVELLGPADTRELTRTFLHDTPRLIADLADSSLAPSGPSVQQIAAHSLKSTSRLVGANALATLAGLLETRLVAGGPPPTVTEILAINDEYERVAKLLARFAQS